MNKKNSKAKPKRLPGVGSNRIVSLRRYLEDNLRQMERLISDYEGRKEGRQCRILARLAFNGNVEQAEAALKEASHRGYAEKSA